LLDKNTAWENLHDRLREKPRRKRMPWYWAAASLLIGITISWMMIIQRDNRPAANISLQKTDNTIVAPPAPIYKKEMIITKRPQQEPIARYIKKNTKVVTVKKTAKKTAAFYFITVATRDVTPITTIDTITTLPGPLITGAATAQKKQLPVIHINELETVSQQMAASPSKKKSRFIQWKNDAGIQPAAVPEKEYAGVSTIKIPLKN
jgi:hypothetical protein